MSPRAKKPRAAARRKKAAAAPTVDAGKVLVLRTCHAGMLAHGGFKWPKSGPVECPDWNPAPVCGGGLHGLLWGEGDGGLLDWGEDAPWLVVEVDDASVVEIDKQKCKFPRGVVVFCGKADDAVKYLSERAPAGKIIVRGTATAGYGGTATAGYGGTATAGYGGTATAGVSGEIRIRHWDEKAERYRTAIAYVGEEGIKPNTPYVVRDGKIVEAEKRS